MRGIDISQWQKGLNLANIDCDFVIVKASEGKTFKDPCFHDFITKAKSLGKCIGFYHFARPENNSSHDEVVNFYDQIKDYIGQGIPFLDWESTAKANVPWAKDWLDEFYSITGIKPMIYMSESVVNSYNWSEVANDGYALWVARYRDYNPDYNYDMSNAGKKPSVKWWKSYAMWQWTSSGRLNGYNANLDCDEFYGNESVWDKYAGKTEDDTLPKEYEYVEVLNGVNTYSKKELGDCFFMIDGRVSNFQIKEFACHDGTDEILIDGDLVQRLQNCRDKFGVTIINSAYRTPEWNKEVGGSPKSQHLLGKASDTVCKGATPLEVAMYAEALGMGGIGLYKTFTHIDTRDGKSRWDSTSGKEVGVSTFLKTIRQGDRNQHVGICQKYLKITQDNIFGSQTAKAVRDFQERNGLVVDEIVGIQTWTKLLTQ